MANIQKYSTPDFKEGLYINLENGEVFATVSSLARLLGKQRQTIQRFLSSGGFDSCNKSEEKTAETNVLEEFDSCNKSEEKTAETKSIIFKSGEIGTDSGKRIAKLIPESVILKAIVKYKPDLAEACLAAGLRVFLHRLAGFEVTTTAIVPAKSYNDLLLESKDLKIQLLEAQSLVLEAKSEVLEAQKLVVEKENYILKATNSRPGLEKMLEDFQTLNPDVKLLPGNSFKVSLYEWMVNNKQIVLEDTLYRKFVSKVHGAYKALYHKTPDIETRFSTNKNKTKVQVYEIKDYSILDQCYKQTILEN